MFETAITGTAHSVFSNSPNRRRNLMSVHNLLIIVWCRAMLGSLLACCIHSTPQLSPNSKPPSICTKSWTWFTVIEGLEFMLTRFKSSADCVSLVISTAQSPVLLPTKPLLDIHAPFQEHVNVSLPNTTGAPLFYFLIIEAKAPFTTGLMFEKLPSITTAIY